MIEPRNRNDIKEARAALSFATDAYVWSEILYLDSATDYREYISAPAKSSSRDEMTIQDDESCWPSSTQWRSIAKRAFGWLLGIFDCRAQSEKPLD
jgi:hypothetical protein